MAVDAAWLTNHIRDSPDYPQPGVFAQIFGDDVLVQIQTPTIDVQLAPEHAAATRQRRAEELAAIAGDRGPLQALRTTFIRRLHCASDDSAATEGLRVVEAALSLIPMPEHPTAGDSRRRPRRRWLDRRESLDQRDAVA